MGVAVTTSAMLTCSFGTAPATFNALPMPRVMVEGKPAGTITDMAPMVNVPPFAMCMSLSNPTVAAATAAALGVLTPMPCVPVPVGPWKPGATKTLVGGKPALENGSTLTCAWGGQIVVTMPGATRTTVS